MIDLSGRAGTVSTYATWWIRQAIAKAKRDTSTLVRLPAHQWDFLSKVQATEKSFMKAHGKMPTLNQISAKLKAEPAQISALRIFRSSGLSLDADFGDENEGSFITSLAAPVESSESPSDSELFKAGINEVLGALRKRDQNVLKLRFGIDTENGEEKTLKEIGQIFKVSRSRAGQIESNSISFLSVPQRNRKLLAFLDCDEEVALATIRARAGA